MYELKINIGDSTSPIWKTADLGNNVPAINIQTNNIADLKQKSGISSQNIKLPLSDNNIRIFNHSNQFDVLSDFPYTIHECRLTQDGYDIAGKGSILVLTKVSDSFECQIGTGITSIFEKLKLTPMSQTDLGYVPMIDSEITNPNPDANYLFGFASFKKEVVRDSITSLSVGKNMFPCAYTFDVIDKILDTHGYTAVYNNEIYEGLFNALTICGNKAGDRSYDGFPSSLGSLNNKQTSFVRFYTKQYVAIPVTSNPVGLLYAFSAGTSPNDDKHITYDCPTDGIVAFTAGLVVSPLTLIKDIYIQIYHNDTLKATIRNNQSYGPSSIEVSKGDVLTARLTLEPSPGIETNTYSTNITTSVSFGYVAGADVIYGSKLPISANLGFETQIDLFKAIIQLYGIIIDVDIDKKLIYMYTYSDVFKNKSTAKDWSNKLNIKGLSTTFAVNGYAQNNRIKLKENSDDSTQDVAAFKINDTTLSEDKTLFEIDFMTTRNILLSYPTSSSTSIVSAANIPLMSSDGATFEGADPQILNYQGTGTVTASINGVTKVFAVLKKIDLQTHINKYYNKLINDILNKSRLIEAEFLLLPEDIATFDQFTPVYIDYYGAYFYVNKISNYGAKALTKCELIRL